MPDTRPPSWIWGCSNSWSSVGVPRLHVLTKADKVPRGQRAAVLATAREALRVGDQETPVFFSAVTGEGVPALWRAVEAMLGAPSPRPAAPATGSAPRRQGAPIG